MEVFNARVQVGNMLTVNQCCELLDGLTPRVVDMLNARFQVRLQYVEQCCRNALLVCCVMSVALCWQVCQQLLY
jgi:hypothetical protein